MENQLHLEDFEIVVATEAHAQYAEAISAMIAESARERAIGIASRTPEYIRGKMNEGKAVIAVHKDGRLAGFCYIETWTHGRYVANSGLIVAPAFRKVRLGKLIKQAAFDLSRTLFPKAKIFSITTSHAVMKMNSDLGYKPVPFSELTDDDEFWNGCNTCKNFDILQRNDRKHCLCTGLLFDPSTEAAVKMSATKNRRVVLAFSGGLDTSYCVKYLTEEKGLEVHTVTVNTGGFSPEELEEIGKHALKLGASHHITLDKTHEFYQNCVRYLIFGNVLKNHTYPLSVSSERAFQAVAVAEYAREAKAGYIAHGSTGAGNDQVRFDMIFHIMLPDVTILTPVRDQRLSRQDSIDYLIKKGVKQDWSKARYSINKGLWGTSVGGIETLTSDGYLPEEAYPTQVTKTEPQTIELEFENGEPVGLDKERFDNPVHVVEKLEALAGSFGIGRDIHVGDTIIGIKGRVGFEAAAPMIILKAHQLLEKHVLTKWQIYWKDQLANWYGNLLHEGQYLDPVMRNIETFLQDSQRQVNGSVFIRLSEKRFETLGIQSDHDLMSSDVATYGEMNNSWSGEDVRGFSKILANQAMLFNRINRDT